MTKSQLLKFVKTRNGSSFSSNLQFQIDAESCGFKLPSLGKCQKEIVKGYTVFRWQTPFGCLVEFGRMKLYPTWEDFVKDCE